MIKLKGSNIKFQEIIKPGVFIQEPKKKKHADLLCNKLNQVRIINKLTHKKPEANKKLPWRPNQRPPKNKTKKQAKGDNK